MKIVPEKLETLMAFPRKLIYKLIIEPVKYGKGNDYDAGRYWHDRFSKYGFDFRGPGHEGLSEEENRKMYSEAGEVFLKLCREEGINFADANVLEIGCGNGFYAQLLHDSGVRNYTGIDITDVLFPQLRENFPEFRFLRNDITSDMVEGEFDLIIMIDVIEHIVSDDKFSFAMQNVRNCLSDEGLFILSPVGNSSKKTLFYVKSWARDDIEQRFPGYVFGKLLPFRSSYIVSIRKSYFP